MQLTLDAVDPNEVLQPGAARLSTPTDELMDMLLSKKRAGDRKQWLESKGDMAEQVI